MILRLLNTSVRNNPAEGIDPQLLNFIKSSLAPQGEHLDDYIRSNMKSYNTHLSKFPRYDEDWSPIDLERIFRFGKIAPEKQGYNLYKFGLPVLPIHQAERLGDEVYEGY